MNNQDLLLPPSDGTPAVEKTVASVETAPEVSDTPPSGRRLLERLTPFWHDRLIEAGMILSMGLYYITGNEHLGTNSFFHLNPLLSLPFLLIFALLCWYRLPFAVALLPLALPYYLNPKTVVGSYNFSPAEIALIVCLAVAILQLLLRRRRWQYWLSWRELRERLGPFTLPILVFAAAAALSVLIAYDNDVARRAFREEIIEPLLYLLLALYCLRSRQDLARLLGALLGTALVVTLLGIAQYSLFRNQLILEAGNIRRVHAAYGSANSIGLLFDYTLPIALAIVVAKLPDSRQAERLRLFAFVICLPLLLVLYLSQSHGAEVAIVAAALLIGALTIRDRKVLLVSAVLLVAIASVGVFFFHTWITDFLFVGHVNAQGVSTVMRRLYLWQSALNMIHDSPWFGYGMDNWLCHYSRNPVCFTPQLHHYWIVTDPVTHALTGLRDEPTLSHPHNIFLQIWVSMGIFGLLAFVALVGLFGWLFARILMHLRSTEGKNKLHLQWMTIGVGAALLAALVQGLGDSSFLEQDLAFCFWMLVTALLLLRVLSGTPWRGLARQMQAV